MGHNQKRDIRKLRQPIRVRDGIIRNKMLDFLLVVKAPVCGYHAHMDQGEAAINTWREGVGRVKSTISSMANSSELTLHRLLELLSQVISGGDGVAAGHLLGVQSSGRVGDLGMTGRPSWLSISMRSVEADILGWQNRVQD